MHIIVVSPRTHLVRQHNSVHEQLGYYFVRIGNRFVGAVLLMIVPAVSMDACQKVVAVSLGTFECRLKNVDSTLVARAVVVPIAVAVFGLRCVAHFVAQGKM